MLPISEYDPVTFLGPNLTLALNHLLCLPYVDWKPRSKQSSMVQLQIIICVEMSQVENKPE